MKLENQLLGDHIGRAEEDPAKTWVDHAELVSRSVDTLDSRQLEAPLEVGRGKRSYHGARGSIDVDGDIEAGFGLILVEQLAHTLHIFVVAGVGATQDYEDTNGILVDVLLD